MTTSFKPLGNRVVVEPLEGEEQVSSGGIYIPDTAKEKPQEGTIVAVGPGRLTDEGARVPMELEVGDSVVY
ncbi:MAG: co-chaperone GroES, partial [SAR202 cluster bacterium]|nr:co-chaperone GroES [SAR202 cluster bacterium]